MKINQNCTTSAIIILAKNLSKQKAMRLAAKNLESIFSWRKRASIINQYYGIKKETSIRDRIKVYDNALTKMTV